MVENIRTLRKELKAAERQSARERQARFQQKQKAEGKQRITAWVTPEDAELIRLVLVAPTSFRNQMRDYLRRAKQSL
ncbi:hypothetical protein [uncultured Cloacibacillus sp.]|uniref:hypothetical protein n=1 Tax=uncultured Cloacibacillus sp. TaxID=889794 RepID=UPI00320933B6